MKTILTVLLTLTSFLTANAYKYAYRFNKTPISEAIVRISKEHPDVGISFIYKELEHYRTSASINTDSPEEALRQAIGLNPISIILKGSNYYIEALQHGKYCYTGRVVGAENEPVVAATVMLLNPNDSSVVTYGMTNESGRFSIPCDRQGVLGKLTCLGYKPIFRKFGNFNVGTIIMTEKAIALKEIKIQGDNALLYSDKSVYLPSSKQKNASNDATDLLRHMAIPQIVVNPIDGEVTSNNGKSIPIYINNMEASKEELQGLNVKDVRKVEYIEFPTDPRFHGAERVINFVVQEYAYGGYTKISTTDDFLIGFSNKSSLYSKFSLKKWTFDLYIASNNKNNHHSGQSVDAYYSLKDDVAKDYEVWRSESVDGSHFKQDQSPITFRSTLNTDKLQVRNTIGYTHSNVNANDQRGTLKITPSISTDYSYSLENPVVSNTCAYDGMLYWMLNNDLSINITPKFSYTHSNDRYAYRTSLQDEDIIRNAREDAYWYRVDATLSKKINKSNTIDFGVNGGELINKLTYCGTNNYYDTFHLGFAAALMSYTYRNQKISLNTRAGVCHEPVRINSIKDHDTYPFAGINFTYTPNYKNSLSSYIEFSTSTPTISTRVSDVLKQNEFLYISGNPGIKSSRMFGAYLSYMWIPSRHLSLSAYGSFMETFNRSVVTFEPYDGGRSLIRSYINNGNSSASSIGVSANWKILADKLQIYANAKQSLHYTTGIYARKISPFSINLQATYYLGSFYFQGYYQSPQKVLYSQSPETYRLRNYHNISIGWSDAHWNLRLTASNFFNKGWVDAVENLDTRFYSSHTVIQGIDTHTKIRISATYIFNYGKKTNVGNEVGEQSGAASAILK